MQSNYELSKELKARNKKLWNSLVMDWVRSAKVHRLGLYDYMKLHEQSFYA